jgi:hypothetical protein
MMDIIRTFPTASAARQYRHDCGTGGWIFAPDPDKHPTDHEAVLFPPHMTPSAIFRHPMTRGRSGRLLGAA